MIWRPPFPSSPDPMMRQAWREFATYKNGIRTASPISFRFLEERT
jgi:hypothetical protein